MREFADLDNDGLTDLWGELGHELRAFRGEAPEAWRALGEFDPAGAANVKTVIAGKSSVDLDGDGIGDALVKGVEAPGTWRHETTGSHTALARSGRDGHVIWKTGVDPSESWFDSGAGECYELSAFPLPHGDFDGDGTPDVIVSERVTRGQTQARPPIQLFSGRTGARLWAAGRLPLGFAAPGNVENIWLDARAVEVNRARISSCAAVRAAQVIVPATGKAIASGKPSLARLSGRDGRVLWDTAIEETVTVNPAVVEAPPVCSDDLDGDGGLDADSASWRMRSIPASLEKC